MNDNQLTPQPENPADIETRARADQTRRIIDFLRDIDSVGGAYAAEVAAAFPAPDLINPTPDEGTSS